MTHSIEARPSRGALPRPGTPAGDQARDAFIADVLAITGDTRLFWLPRSSETTTSTDRSRNARTFTYDATVASRYSQQGSGVAVTFDGTDDEADVPDADSLSFGDSQTDEPLSIVVVFKPTVEATNRVFLCKDDYTTGNTFREWTFQIEGNGYLIGYVFDNSAAARLGRSYQVALTSVWQMAAMTYDGSAASTGIRIYRNAARVDNAADDSGTYTAMENLGETVKLGHNTVAAGSAGDFFDGDMAMVLLVAKQLSADENLQLKGLVNAYFDLTL